MILIKKLELITVNVIYYRNDYPNLLNEFIWQTEDIIPDIPKVHKFLNYWKYNNLATVKDILLLSSNSKSINYTNFYEKI